MVINLDDDEGKSFLVMVCLVHVMCAGLAGFGQSGKKNRPFRTNLNRPVQNCQKLSNTPSQKSSISLDLCTIFYSLYKESS